MDHGECWLHMPFISTRACNLQHFCQKDTTFLRELCCGSEQHVACLAKSDGIILRLETVPSASQKCNAPLLRPRNCRERKKDPLLAARPSAASAAEGHRSIQSHTSCYASAWSTDLSQRNFVFSEGSGLWALGPSILGMGMFLSLAA